MNKRNEAVWVVASKGAKISYEFSHDVVHDVSQLPKIGCRLVILNFDVTDDWLSALTTLRRMSNYRLTPVFFDGKLDARYLDLFDGCVDDQMFLKSDSINEHINMVPEFNRMGSNQELLLLSYLFARFGLDIQGYLTYQAKYIFNYPLLNLLFADSEDYDAWTFLQGLVSRDLLAQESLIDEIQACPHCDAGLLNFKNCCPNCHSVDIKPQKFIHCLTCGDIGPVSEFMRQERLVCGKCHTKLRQIGIDYEKPEEDKICNHCGYFFIEAIANVVCLVCQRISLPQDLVSRRLYCYALTKRGEYFARGLEKTLYQYAGHFFNFIDFSSFMAIVNWQIKLAQRADEEYFFILSLSVVNEEDILTNQGHMATEKLLGEFFSKVRLLLRDTDLATRDQGLTLFFLPLTNEKGVKKLANRVASFVNSNVSGEQVLDVKVSYLSSKEIILNQLTDDTVVSELANRMINET